MNGVAGKERAVADTLGLKPFLRPQFKPQIREQMSGPDLHVFTLKFLALKKLGFPP